MYLLGGMCSKLYNKCKVGDTTLLLIRSLDVLEPRSIPLYIALRSLFYKVGNM